MRRTKIICTIGPASDGPQMINALIFAGMDVARLNFSHGRLEEHAERIRLIRACEAKTGRHIAVLQDIQGPKIRVGQVAGSPRPVAKGERLFFTDAEEKSNPECIYVPYPHLTRDLRPDQKIYLDDGLIELQVVNVEPGLLECLVTVGGELKSRMGMTLPGVRVDLPPLGENDLVHIRFGVEHGVDYIAASFVRRAAHVEAVRRVVESFGGNIPIIAKIESEEGVANIEEIIAAADGVMVARGDLGIELPPEEVPLVQKHLISRCNQAGKPVITATQMLDSMIRNPRPTRAEVTDVANAILDGTDAVMLSGETAVGKYPVEAVLTLAKVAERAEDAMAFGRIQKVSPPSDGRHFLFSFDESNLSFDENKAGHPYHRASSVAEAIARATCETAHTVKAKAIICSTQSGATARLVSKYRPRPPIVAVTPNESVVRRLSLIWGVYPVLGPKAVNTDDMMDVAMSAALHSNIIKKGDVVAVAAGVRTGEPGSTNLLQIHMVS